MFGLYAAGIASALGVSCIFNRLFWRQDPTDPFMLELPDYKRPVLRNLALGLWQRAQIFLTRAGTTIFSMMVVIWFLCSVPPPPADAAGGATGRRSTIASPRALARRSSRCCVRSASI